MSAIASQLLATLDTYEREIDRLVGASFDADLYMKASESFEQLRLYAAALPRAQVPWIEVLISRFELSHSLWERRHATRTDGRILGFHAHHKTALNALRRRCAQSYTAPEA